MSSAPPRAARPTLVVVGATGAVGGTLLRLVSTRQDVWGQIRLAASARSVGAVRAVRDEELEVQALGDELFAGADAAIFTAPEAVAREWAPRAAEQGVVVLDASAAFRADPDVPLVAAEVNPAQARNRPRGILASPGSPTLAMVDALAALHHGWELTAVLVTSCQAASQGGRAGIDRLYDELEVVAGSRDLGQQAGDVRAAVADKLGERSPFPGPLGLNVLPWAGEVRDEGWSSDELATADEVRRVLALPGLPVSVTAVRVPVVTGHSMSVHATFSRRIGVAEARQALVEAPSVVVLDDPGTGEWPTPVDVVGADPTFVGRIRQAAGQPQSLELFVCADNLRRGAAVNLAQVGELIARELSAR